MFNWKQNDISDPYQEHHVRISITHPLKTERNIYNRTTSDTDTDFLFSFLSSFFRLSATTQNGAVDKTKQQK